MLNKYHIDQIPPALIDTSWCLLRNNINTDVPEFRDLCESVKTRGVLDEIWVRYATTDKGEKIISLVDGLRRFTAARTVKLDTIPCKVLEDCSDEEAMSLQLILNLHRENNSGKEISGHVNKLTELFPGMSVLHIAQTLSKPVAWVKKQLKLEHLGDEIFGLVTSGAISAANAVWLAKIDPKERDQWIERAKQTKAQDFMVQVKLNLRQNRSLGLKLKNGEEWEPMAVFSKRVDLVKEIKTPRALVKLAKVLEDSKASILEAVVEGVKYSLQTDRISLKARLDEHARKELEGKRVRLSLEEEKKKAQIKELEAEIEKMRKSLETTEGS